jgi:hypothetical protein
MARDLARYLQPPTRREKAMRAKLAAEPNVTALKLLRRCRRAVHRILTVTIIMS